MAADSAGAEPLDEWQHLSPLAPPLPKWHDSLLIRDNYLREECLDPVPQPQPPLLSSSDDEQQQQQVVVTSDNEAKEDGLGGARPRSCGVLGAVYRVVCNSLFLGRGTWSTTAAAGIVAVVVASWAYTKFRKLKWWRWKRSGVKEESAAVENLILLVKHKEERINQLMLQIARMNEVMSAQRSVRVVRID